MFIFYLLGVGLPCRWIFCQFWLCEEAQCVYLRRHLGSLRLFLSQACLLPKSCPPAKDYNLLPTIKLGPSGAGSRVGGLVHALGPCGSLQRPLL